MFRWKSDALEFTRKKTLLEPQESVHRPSTLCPATSMKSATYWLAQVTSHSFLGKFL